MVPSDRHLSVVDVLELFCAGQRLDVTEILTRRDRHIRLHAECAGQCKGSTPCGTRMALLERGRPMTVEEIAERLTESGAVVRSGDMVLALKKAWHGREPS